MKTLLRCSALFFFVSVSAFAFAAPARAATTRVEVRALLVNGIHTETGSTSTVAAQVVPMLEITTSEKRWAFSAEATSSLGSRAIVATSGFNPGPTSVRLSNLNAVVRYRLNSATSLGIGETIYNQASIYDQNIPFGEPYAEASRVVGARFEIRREFYATAHSRWNADLAVNPHLSASLVEYEPSNDADGDEGIIRATPEAGSQVDVSIENRVSNKRYSLTYGLRYINLSMYFPYHELADRNAFVIPFVGIARSFGS